MKELFEKLQKALEEAVAQRNIYREELHKLNVLRPEQSVQYNEQQKAKLEQKTNEIRTAQYEKVGLIINEIKTKVEAKQAAPLNPFDPDLQTAISLIATAGQGLDPQVAREINNRFIGNQKALQFLKTIYDGKRASSGKIEDLLYIPDDVFPHLSELNYWCFFRDGSFNSFAIGISKLARLEGLTFPTMIDEVGSTEAIRKAAGLQLGDYIPAP